jgi:hypothetical protein
MGSQSLRSYLSCLSRCLLLSLIPAASSALTPAQAYLKAAQFLRSQSAAGFESHEAQAVLLGEAIGGDPLAAGPRSTALLASLELASVDARARRARTLGALGLRVSADATALLAARTPNLGFGVSREHLPTALDTALAIQGLDAAGLGGSQAVGNAANDLTNPTPGAPLAPSGGLWRLLRKPDAAGGGTAGDIATTAQAVLALQPRQGTYSTAFNSAVTALAALPPPSLHAGGRALRVLALVEAGHPGAGGELDTFVALQNADGSFGTEPLAQERVYATALAARAIQRAGQLNFPFDSDGDTIADGPDPNSDNDGVCDPGESGAGCTGTDAFPTDPDEWADLDLDGIGGVADLDDDGDGILDASEPGFGTVAQERLNTDGDALADTADSDDDNDGILDVEELLAGLDPRDVDTDNDTFRDNLELAAGKDGANPLEYPLPDGDVFPLGAPDGLVDARDELLIHRILRGLVTVPGGSYTAFLLHADVAPLISGAPAPSGFIDAADAMVITRRVRGMVAAW